MAWRSSVAMELLRTRLMTAISARMSLWPLLLWKEDNLERPISPWRETVLSGESTRDSAGVARAHKIIFKLCMPHLHMHGTFVQHLTCRSRGAGILKDSITRVFFSSLKSRSLTINGHLSISFEDILVSHRTGTNGADNKDLAIVIEEHHFFFFLSSFSLGLCNSRLVPGRKAKNFESNSSISYDEINKAH